MCCFVALGVRSKGNAPKNGEPIIYFPFHDNSPAHRSVSVKDFLALKGRRFCNTNDIAKNATAELKMLLRNGFQKCLQQLQCRRQKCVVAQGHYFEGTVA
jgi:hypothetical protein